MEGEEDTQRPTGRENHNWTHRRNWTRRCSGPVQYERFSALNAGGEARIFFSFTLLEGQDRLDDRVHRILTEHKHWPDGYPTGLKYSHDRIHGKTFNLPDSEPGRDVADRVDRKLKALAAKIEREVQER